MLRTRLATAAVAIPVLWCFVQLLWAPAFAAFILLVIAVGAAEYGWMAFPDAPRVRALTVVGAVGVALGTMAGGPWSEVALATAFLAAVVSPLALPANLGDGLRRAAVAWFGVVYVGFLTAHVVVLRNSSAEGWRWVLFTIFVGMASDTGGYFGGRWFGRRKLFPAVSPSKTVEGALGSVVGALVLALLSRAVFFDRAGTLEALGVAIVVSVLGQCGDLAESALKRAFGAKDSGWIVPGHGGILDRLDSLLLPVVFVWIWVVVAGR